MRERHDIVVIGGGQAGLAMSTVLQRGGHEHVVLERRRVGERWRTERWDSLRFQFPNWSIQLPGYTYRGEDPDGFAHYREIVGVVENYAASSKDVYWWLEKLGRFAQTVDTFPDRRPQPSTVITGVNGDDVDVRRMAAEGVTVVGRVVGASDGMVALAANANAILDEADQAYAGFLAAAREFVTNAELQGDLAEESPGDPPPLPAALEERDSLDLDRENITTILWATGYTYDYGWIKVPVFDDRGRPVQNRGVTQVPGLYFLGLHWMHTFKSGLFSGVGSDAEYLAEHMGLACGR